MDRFDAVVLAVSGLARGQSLSLRIGYLPSAAGTYLHPALQILRKLHPEVKVKLVDLTPGEQIVALREGQIDLGMLDDLGSFLRREFFIKKIASVSLRVVLSEHHRLAKKSSIRLSDLKGERFVPPFESDLPGYTQRIVKLCRTAGFRPRFVEEAESLAHGLALTLTDGAVMLARNSRKPPRRPA